MGRGSSGLGAGGMNVAWDKWGDVLGSTVPPKEVRDKDGNVIGYVRDELYYTSVEEERTVTR